MDEEQHNYYPVVFFNQFWLLREHLIPLNSTVDSLRLSLTLHGMASFKFMMYNQMEESFKMQARLCLVQQAAQACLTRSASWYRMLHWPQDVTCLRLTVHGSASLLRQLSAHTRPACR